MKINAVRLFLLILGLFLLFFTGPSLAEITYNIDIDPANPSVNSYVTANAYSSWACDENSPSSMRFDWTQGNRNQPDFTQYVDYVSGNDYAYSSHYFITKSGTWDIYYEEFDGQLGNGDSVGGGGQQDKVSFQVALPEFSSYIFVIISLLSIYFILRKKLVS